MLTKARNLFFQRLNLTVMLFTFIYGLVYFFLGARFSALNSFFCGCVLIPTILFLNGRNYPTASRFLFLLAALWSIYSTSLGIPLNLHEEFYYIPATMLPLLIFDPKEKGKILIGFLIPLVGYGFSRWGPTPAWSQFWSPVEFPVALFRELNFLGAFVITVLFVGQYGKYLNSLQTALVRELSHSKMMERSLEEAQSLGRLGSFSWNLATNQEIYSKEALRIYGRDPEKGSLTAQDRLDCYFPEDRPNFISFLNDLKNGEDNLYFQSRLKLPDGSVHHVRHQGRIVKSKEGTVEEVLMTIQDITEQEHVYQLLVQSSKMSALGEMASGIAHEINNPLTIIHLLSEQIKSALSKTNAATIIENCANKIDSTIWRISKIIQGLRLFSRQAESIPFEIADIKDIVDETLSFCREKIESHEIQLKVSVPPEKVPVECSPVQISQALLNLLNNSYAAVENLKERWIHLEIQLKDSSVQISVTDSGPGIPEPAREKLFQPFYTTKEVGSGTGLGLSITKGIIETHKGTIKYDPSSPNTRFIITLPKAPERTADPSFTLASSEI